MKDSTHMCAVNINQAVSHLNLTQTNTFATKPVTMMNFVDITIQRPLVKENILNYPFGEHTEARTKDTTAR